MIDPLSWLLAKLGSSFGPLVAVGLILLLLFWGRIWGALRTLALGALRAVRRASLPKGAKPCPDCASALSPARDGQECRACRGLWLAEADLARIVAAKRQEVKDWLEEEGPLGGLCPTCSAPMRPGRLRGEDFVVYRCAACPGLWFGSVERISLELRVLS